MTAPGAAPNLAPTAHGLGPFALQRSAGSGPMRPIEPRAPIGSPASSALAQAHRLYKAAVSPFLHTFGFTGSCRFQPTCSEYATIAIAQHGPSRGLWLALTRLLRCHPFSRGGWDPVPSAYRTRGRRPDHCRVRDERFLLAGVESEAPALDFRTEDAGTQPHAASTGTIEMRHSTNEPA